MKLMKGIEETESQIQKEKQPQKSEEQEKVENESKDTKEISTKPQKAKKQSMSKKNTVMRKKAVIEPDRMSKKQIFSFRAVVADITIWRAYAIAKGETVENLGNAAMEEYLKRHKLSGTELAIFDALKTREGIGRKEEE